MVDNIVLDDLNRFIGRSVSFVKTATPLLLDILDLVDELDRIAPSPYVQKVMSNIQEISKSLVEMVDGAR